MSDYSFELETKGKILIVVQAKNEKAARQMLIEGDWLYDEQLSCDLNYKTAKIVAVEEE